MSVRKRLTMALILLGVASVGLVLGCWAGRPDTRREVDSDDIIISDTPVALRESRRIRLYLGAQIQGEPAFTIIAGRVYRGDAVGTPFLTLEEGNVYSGAGTDGPLLYRFDDDQVLEGAGDTFTRFVQRGDQIYFGSDPQAPVLFTFKGTRIYQGDPSRGRVLATSNTMLSDPDLIKLVAIVLYMETLE